MKVAYLPERNDLVVVTLAGGRAIYARIQNVADDGSIYCMKTDGTVDFICAKYKWDQIEQVWAVKGCDVTT